MLLLLSVVYLAITSLNCITIYTNPYSNIKYIPYYLLSFSLLGFHLNYYTIYPPCFIDRKASLLSILINGRNLDFILKY